MNAQKTQELAKRIFNLLPWWDLEPVTVEELAKDIETRPAEIITMLLDICETMNA